MRLAHRLSAELIGTAFLLATVVGSGIMAENLSDGNIALALLGNTLPTGAILVVLITAFGPISGAHFNPAVTVVFTLKKQLSLYEAQAYMLAQILGALIGVFAAHMMFEQDILQFSQKIRTGSGQWFAEAVATFGLIVTILITAKVKSNAVAMAVGLYITAAYWFTASTSFANPAVTFARGFSDSFAGIQLQDVTPFIVVQLGAAVLAFYYCRWQLAYFQTDEEETEHM